MSKSLRSITSDYERQETIKRRLTQGEKGLGYWAAVDAQNKQNAKKAQKPANTNE